MEIEVFFSPSIQRSALVLPGFFPSIISPRELFVAPFIETEAMFESLREMIGVENTAFTGYGQSLISAVSPSFMITFSVSGRRVLSSPPTNIDASAQISRLRDEVALITAFPQEIGVTMYSLPFVIPEITSSPLMIDQMQDASFSVIEPSTSRKYSKA